MTNERKPDGYAEGNIIYPETRIAMKNMTKDEMVKILKELGV